MQKRKRKFLIAFIFLVGLFAYFFFRHTSPRVIGNLSDADLEKIQSIVWDHLKEFEKPPLERDSFRYPRYFFSGYSRFEQLKILWIRVENPDYVRVVAGITQTPSQAMAGISWSKE